MRVHARLFAATAAALLAAPAARAATYTIDISSGLDLQSVSTGATGDTVFRISPATGAVAVQSGAGRRLSTTSVRAQVSISCRAAGVSDTDCATRTVAIRAGSIGTLTGRARALTNFTVAMGTATLAAPPSGTNPLSVQLAPLGENSPNTFFIGADFPVAGDDTGLATGNGENSFYVYMVNSTGLQLAGDTDKGKVKALRALAVAKTADLSFGRLQIPTSGTSLVTLSESSGARTITGAGFAYPTPAPTRGAFTISGEGGQQVSLTIPATLTLARAGSGTLAVDITSTARGTPSLSGGLGGAGGYSFTLGGSFTITPATPTGAYSGVMTVSIDYN